MDRLKVQVDVTPDILPRNDVRRKYLGETDRNLEGTYLVRLFAAFEAALRSYDRARHHDPTRKEDASVLIDSIGGRRGQGISGVIRERAHAVRKVRNYWAHENDELPTLLSLVEARASLQTFLSWLPEAWD